jgi:medium-chain acyl-[acyl-carrier-protein] hydrolase
MKHSETSGLICLRDAPPTRLRLFCFPYAGGGASAFRSWAAAMPPGVALYGYQPPGRENRIAEPLAASLDEVVPPAERGVRALVLDGAPFVLFGHSLGALVAFSITCRMEMTGGVVPRHLMVSGCIAPHRRADIPVVHDLPEPEFIDWVRALGGTPDGVWAHAELRELLVPILRADFRLFASFSDEKCRRIRTPIMAFGGIDDRAVPHDGLAAWRERTSGGATICMLPGDHFFLHSSQGLLLDCAVRVLGQPVAKGLPGRQAHPRSCDD